MERSRDWMKQAGRDLEHARQSVRLGHHEWACFSAQQAAEKAVKAVFEARHAEAWGHSVSRLLRALEEEVPEDLLEAAAFLDQYYIPTRYPNGFDSGAPMDYYTRTQAEQAIGHAERILEYCGGQIPSSGRGDWGA